MVIITRDLSFFLFLVLICYHNLGFWFLVCYAATQLATQLQQRCIQVVCSNKEARKRLTESNGTPAMDLGHMNQDHTRCTHLHFNA